MEVETLRADAQLPTRPSLATSSLRLDDLRFFAVVRLERRPILLCQRNEPNHTTTEAGLVGAMHLFTYSIFPLSFFFSPCVAR
jgi:hypothetical protein